MLTPFEAMFGHKPRHFGLSVDSVGVPSALDSWMQDRHNMQSLIHHHLVRAQQRMKSQADSKRTDRVFAVADWVFMKLQPYVQQFVMTRANQKLAFKFYGPFQILQRVGSVAYKLQLPATSLIHPVVHVSQLKKAVAASEVVQSTLPRLDPDSGHLATPVEVLQQRLRRRGDKMIVQALVRWSGTSSSTTSWEDLEELRHRFPSATAWSQAVFQGRGNVTSGTGTPDDEQEQVSKIAGSVQSTAQQRHVRVTRPNPKYKGGNWVN